MITKYLPVIVIAIIASLLCCEYRMTLDNPEVSDAELSYCTADTDCIMVKKTCCGCEAGGESFSINMVYENYWNDRMTSQCGSDFTCITVNICPLSAPQCLSNSCTLTK